MCVLHVLQVLRYFDYVFTGVFTFEMIIKVVTATRPFFHFKYYKDFDLFQVHLEMH